jgi:hypothetical protein
MKYATYVEADAVLELEGAVDVAVAPLPELVRVTPCKYFP